MSTPPASTPNRGRGRGKSQNRGKALRARGRRGIGRGAVFGGERLVLDGESVPSMTEEEQEEQDKLEALKFGKRGLGSNADRYLELDEEENEGEGKEDEEGVKEVLARHLQKEQQKVTPVHMTDDDVDHTLSHIGASSSREKEHNIHTIEWDPALNDLRDEIDRVEASRDLKERFRAKSERLLRPTSSTTGGRHAKKKVEAPSILAEGGEEEFLDDLLG